MPKRRLLWQLYPSYLVITLAALVGVGWFAANSFERFYVGHVRDDLERQARYLESRIGQKLFGLDYDQLTAICESLGESSHSRLTVISPNGQVVFDSSRGATPIADEAHRPEVVQAFDGEPSTFMRIEPGTAERSAVVALPILRGGLVIGVVHASQSIAAADAAIRSIKTSIALAALVILVLAALVGLWISRQITRPLSAMRQGAERFARGELGYKLPSPNSEELAGLAEALNQMAAQLQERIGTIVRQSNQQQAVLGSMSEGVLAVDNEERVITVNAAFEQLLNIDRVHAPRRSLQEVVRNTDLRRFVRRALECRAPIEDVVTLHGEQEGVLQARGAALHDAEGQSIGAVVVLNDVTHFRRLENIRRDFVANVSHELKTPIAAIKGFVETLLDGAVEKPEEAQRFLNIVAKQADRLNAIIEDLLSLSKIEQGEDAGDLVLERGNVKGLLEGAVRDCEGKATERRIQVRVTCEEGLIAEFNAPLLDQAIVNLLDNAIKYSEPGSEVRVDGSQANGEVMISVSDRGCGIAPEHLPRIFERFYRVDKARSRRLGGTGLGLAIVKHIVQAHRGHVAVRSSLGSGSTFTIYLLAAGQGGSGKQ